MKLHRKSLLLFLILTLLLPGCGLVGAPTPSPDDMVATIVAATVAALPSSTPLPPASATPLPTRPRPTSFPTATPVNTVTPFPSPTVTETPTPTETNIPAGGREIGKIQGSGNYACQLLDQKPGDWEFFKPEDVIYVFWEVKNVGTKDWRAGDIEIMHLSGEKIYRDDRVFKNQNYVPVGGSMGVIVPMVAPSYGGGHMTTWGLRRGDKVFCDFSFSLLVK